MSTLKGVFSSPKPTRRNFVLENVRRLKELQKLEGKSNTMVVEAQKKPTSKPKFPTLQLNVPPHLTTTTKSGSKTKQSGLKAQMTKSAQAERPKDTLTKSQPKANKKESDMVEYVRQQCEAKQNLNLDLSSNGSADLEFIKSPTSNDSPKTHRTTASQTINSKDLDKLYIDGTIRYPTATQSSAPINRVMQKSKPSGSGVQAHQTLNYQKKLKAKSPKNGYNSSQKTLSKPSGDADGFVNLSKLGNHFDSGTDTSEEGLHQDSAILLQRNARTGRLGSPPRSPLLKSINNPLVPPASYQRGALPKYLQKHQENEAKENETIQKVAHAIDPSCPPNHILLPENERKETVKMLRKNYADFVKELNMLPVRTDTLRMQKRKMELEKQLNKLEEGIKLFSRPKVYVKIGT